MTLLLEDLVRSGRVYAARDRYDDVAVSAEIIRLPSGRPLILRIEVRRRGRRIDPKCYYEGGLVEAARRELLGLIDPSLLPGRAA